MNKIYDTRQHNPSFIITVMKIYISKNIHVIACKKVLLYYKISVLCEGYKKLFIC